MSFLSAIPKMRMSSAQTSLRPASRTCARLIHSLGFVIALMFSLQPTMANAQFQPEPGAVYNIIECTRGENFAAGSDNNVLRWAGNGGPEQMWRFLPFAGADGSFYLQCLKNGWVLSVDGLTGNVFIDAKRDPANTDQKFRLEEISDAEALKSIPKDYTDLIRTATKINAPRTFHVVRIHESTRDEFVAVGGTGRAVRWGRIDEATQVFILSKVSAYSTTYTGPISKDVRYAYNPDARNKQSPWVWEPKGPTTRTVYSPLDGLPLMTYTASLEPEDTDGCSTPMLDPTTQAFKEIFASAGCAHDVNYTAPWTEIGWGHAGQQITDLIFLYDMKGITNTSMKTAVEKNWGNTVAETWYRALHDTFGKAAYDQDQASHKSRGIQFSNLQKGGVISITNNGGYLLKTDVKYTASDGRPIQYSEVQATGFSSTIPLSLGARDIEVVCSAVGGTEIFKKSYPAAQVDRWVVDGTTLIHSAKQNVIPSYALGAATLPTDRYYRLTTQWRGDDLSLDIVPDGQNNRPILAKTGAFTGQFWKLTPVPGGYYRLTTQWRGDDLSLDIVNDGQNNRPLLAKTGPLSGQFWKLISVPGGYYRLTTQWRGDDLSLDIVPDGQNNRPVLAKTGAFTGQFWKLTPLHSVPK